MISLNDYRKIALTVILWPPETMLSIGGYKVRADQVDLHPLNLTKKLIDIDKYQRSEYTGGRLDLG